MERIPLFPLDVVLFPGELFGLHIFEDRYVLMTEECLARDLPMGIVLARQDEPEDRIEHEPERVGTAARILEWQKIGDRYFLQTVGIQRFRIRRVLSEKPYQEADVEWLDEEPGDPAATEDLAERVLDRLEDMGGAMAKEHLRDPVVLSHVVAASLPLDLLTKQRLLEAENAHDRLRVEADLLRVR